MVCPTIAIDRGPCAKRQVVPLSILRTHWINERRLCAVKACLLATPQTALANSARRQSPMQSHGGPKLVAELPQCLKNQQRTERLIQMVESNVRYGSKP